MKKPIAELRASYYTSAPSNRGTLVACHYEHHQPMYIHLLLCQLSKEQIPINIPNHETKVYQERTENPATTTMYAITRGKLGRQNHVHSKRRTLIVVCITAHLQSSICPTAILP